MDGLCAMQDLTLVLGSALRGVAPGSHLITNDDAAWWRVISYLKRALTRCAPLVVKTPLGVWFYRWTQASHMVGQDRVEAGGGH